VDLGRRGFASGLENQATRTSSPLFTHSRIWVNSMWICRTVAVFLFHVLGEHGREVKRQIVVEEARGAIGVSGRRGGGTSLFYT
jgi:hypothetical protein